VNFLPLREGERIQSVLSTRDFTEGQYLVFATRNGIAKKTEFLAYNTPIKADGIIAINIRDDDELVAVRRTSGENDILMVSRKGQAVRFHEDALRAMGRATSGVRGMDVSGKDDAVLAMDVAREDQELLVVTENGYGKRTPIDQYRKTNRGTKGVGTIKLTEAKGALAGALVVREHYDLVFISSSGMVQRTGVRGISQYGRLSQGVRVMNMKPEDTVSAVAVVVETSEADPASAEVAETVATEGPIDMSADGGEGGVMVSSDGAPGADELTSPDAAAASESALSDGAGEDEPDEVDLDEIDGPPTPDA
jgi:DNA gyrase subunit A